MRVTLLIIYLFVLITLSASTVHAQACGRAFNTVKVLDSEGRNIRSAIIEIVAQLPWKEYEKELRQNKIVKISEQDAEDIIKQDLPMDMTKGDVCGNPLKQRANVTKVKSYPVEALNIENLGFCTYEAYFHPFLLRVSASGYLTDYSLGYYLGGCGETYEIVLTKKKRKIVKTKKSN